MVAKNIEKSWKLPCANREPEYEYIKGIPRVWWELQKQSNVPAMRCPLCKFREATVKTIGKKEERSCAECAHLHFRTIKIEVQGVIHHRVIYVDTETLIKESKYRRELLEDIGKALKLSQ